MRVIAGTKRGMKLFSPKTDVSRPIIDRVKESLFGVLYGYDLLAGALVADLFSLWLCCDCPGDGAEEINLGQTTMKLQTDALLGQFQFSVLDFATLESSSGGRIAGLDWMVAVQPYPCKSRLQLSADCIAAPVQHYETWPDLEAASWPVRLRWQLVESSSWNGEPMC